MAIETDLLYPAITFSLLLMILLYAVLLYHAINYTLLLLMTMTGLKAPTN